MGTGILAFAEMMGEGKMEATIRQGSRPALMGISDIVPEWGPKAGRSRNGGGVVIRGLAGIGNMLNG